VVVADLNEDGEKTASIIRNNGGDAMYFRADVTDEEQVKRMVRLSVEQYGRLDVVFNGVGNWLIEHAYHDNSSDLPLIVRMPLSVYKKLLEVNLISAFLVCKYAMVEMWKTGQGSIINIGSVVGIKPGEYMGYGSAKGALAILTDSLAMQGSRQGKHIRVNIIVPGDVDTPSMRQSLEAERSMSWTRADTYLKGEGKEGMLLPEDIAYCALYLASDESRMVTGTQIVVDGGGLGI
jgi:NAD(P)-dependent dehydrogenase (short-subunit alcohol dehydrogenase family)